MLLAVIRDLCSSDSTDNNAQYSRRQNNVPVFTPLNPVTDAVVSPFLNEGVNVQRPYRSYGTAVQFL